MALAFALSTVCCAVPAWRAQLSSKILDISTLDDTVTLPALTAVMNVDQESGSDVSSVFAKSKSLIDFPCALSSC